MTVLRRAAAVLLAAFFIFGEAEAGQSGQPLSILDVPYISQSEALCGGAAAAMVLRYWGARGLDAQSFEHLLDRSAAGIRTTALVAELRGRGWTTLAIEGTADAVSRELARGRPLLTLIEDRPGTFHYVVVVGATPRAVVFHDPARTPFRTMSREEFERRSVAAGRWMALVLPGPRLQEAEASVEAIVPESSCDALIADGVRLAQANDLEGAARRLTSALSCGGSAPLRELAGVRLLQRRWPEVSDLAAAAVVEDPDDAYARRLLATSRFVQEDREGALEAWNHVNEPRVDLIRIDGLFRTRQSVVERLIGVPRREVLTPQLFTTARRRLSELPSASATALQFVPVPSGLVEMRATVTERPLVPRDRWSYTVIGVMAAFKREVEVSTGAFTGGGERFTLGWRFWPGRPRVSGAVLAPAPWGGVWGVDGFAERQPFTGDAISMSRRSGSHATVSNWITSWARAGVTGGIERWDGLGSYGTVGVDIRAVKSGERIEGRVDLSGWSGAGSFGTMELGATLRSSTVRRGFAAIARTGAGLATASTPADLWFAGDTGRARSVPLRAHPVIADGELRVDQIGRRIAYGSGEVQRWWTHASRVQIGAAVFVDAVRAGRRLDLSSRSDVDLGVGARLGIPGLAGAFRVDVAKGLRDGATALSFVYQP